MKYAADGRRFWECAADLWFPERALVTGPAPGVESPPGMAVDAVLEMDQFSVHFRITSVRLYWDQPDGHVIGGVDIDTEMYRSVRLMELRAGIGSDLAFRTSDLGDDVARFSFLTHRENDLPESPDIAEVSRVYARSRLSGRRPQREVSEQLGTSTATAGRWIRRARELGALKLEGASDGVN